tara:strand:+ start:337 stop:783 length:447 start_codon:yes stop_codon:yes gene_type:complete
MTNDKITLGALGEQVIYELFENAKKTNDWFDSTKDGTITDDDGSIKTYEVKTMRANNKHQGLFQNPTQFKKLDNVDLNLWVRVPEKVEDRIRVYEYFASDYDEVHMNGTDGRMYPISKMEHVATVDNLEITEQMLELSKGLSVHKRFK